MVSSLAVRKETDWKHMSVALPALWLLTCTSQSHPHSDTLLQRALEVIFMLTDVETVRLAEWQSKVIGKLWFESAVSVRRMDHAIWNMNLKVSVALVTAQLHLGSKWHRTGLLTKCCKKAGRKKKRTKSSVCVLTAFQVIYTEWKNCVDFMSLLGENY